MRERERERWMTEYPRLALRSVASSLCLPSAVVADVYHHDWWK
jgi:hypothetical protein